LSSADHERGIQAAGGVPKPIQSMPVLAGMEWVEFIDENDGGPGVRLRKRHHLALDHACGSAYQQK
jgi:hypothetical protein